MSNAPQVATQEISDADLDNVSGGLLGGAISTVVGTADSIAPVSGIIGTATGIVGSATGLNPAGALGVVGTL